DVGLVVVGACLVAGLVGALALLLGLADHLAALRVPVALADAGGVFAIGEPMLPDAADRHLDDAIAVLPDDGLLRDDVGDILADGLADLDAMACPIAGRAVAAFRVRRRVGPEDGVAHAGDQGG